MMTCASVCESGFGAWHHQLQRTAKASRKTLELETTKHELLGRGGGRQRGKGPPQCAGMARRARTYEWRGARGPGNTARGEEGGAARPSVRVRPWQRAARHAHGYRIDNGNEK